MERWPIFALAAFLILPFHVQARTYSCVSLEYPPLIEGHTDGPPSGLAVEIVKRVMQRLGHTVTVNIYPWARSLALVKMGEADCIFTLYRSPEREAYLDYSNESLINQVIYFYARKESAVRFDGNLASLRELNVGTAHKVNYGPKFENARLALKIDEAPTIEQNFRKLALGRVDIVPSNLYTASSTLARPSLQDCADKIVRLPMPVETVASYIAFSKHRGLLALRDSFDAELRRFTTTDEYRHLLSRYTLDDASGAARIYPER